jgi:hypothetical protein
MKNLSTQMPETWVDVQSHDHDLRQRELIKPEGSGVDSSFRQRLSSTLITLKSWVQSLHNILLDRSQVKVWQTRDRFGNLIWHAYDPETDQSIIVGSENEMRVWLEHRDSFCTPTQPCHWDY